MSSGDLAGGAGALCEYARDGCSICQFDEGQIGPVPILVTGAHSPQHGAFDCGHVWKGAGERRGLEIHYRVRLCQRRRSF